MAWGRGGEGNQPAAHTNRAEHVHAHWPTAHESCTQHACT